MNHLLLLEQIQAEKWKTISEQFNIDTICVFGSITVKIQALDDGVTVFTKDSEQSLERCREKTEHYYRINRSFFAKRRRELLS